MKRFLSNVKSARTIEKLEFMFSDVLLDPLDARLMARLREFNLLRNNLLHGRLYEKWVLVEDLGGPVNQIVDEEDTYDWDSFFPQTSYFNFSFHSSLQVS